MVSAARAVFAALLIAGCASSVPHGDEIENVRHTEDQVADALRRNDAETLGRLWSPDYVFVNPAGHILTRDQRLAMLRSGEFKYEAYSRDQETIRVYGTTAVVVYRSNVIATRGGRNVSSHRRVSTVLVKSNGQWQVVTQQSTPIEGE